MKSVLKVVKLVVLVCVWLKFNAVQSQIIYTDVDPDKWSYNLPIDLNNDSKVDFTVNIDNAWYYFAYIICQSNDQEVLSDYRISKALALNEGVVIGPNQNSWIQLATPENYSDGNLVGVFNDGSVIGYWQNVQDKYLGLRFKINGKTHYGWARLSMPLHSQGFLKDYAYNATADESIIAGQKVLNVEDTDFYKIKFLVSQKIITVLNLVQETRFKIYNVSGQMQLMGHLNQVDNLINAQYLSSGLYFIELVTEYPLKVSKMKCMVF
ncbi:T9SS type A sorting domain-containing protein [Aestuariibaculum sp. M13]|uniref:T9SS type A sorting domain-containing protein n=1 Tax=Aestuariibaculum sp. M13 TaxID=2967132 RepID=UPI002159D7E5|nr:T9SS type A sorting domain-containing protein [Aestuariibaculum sp. M13]MCR8666118.1 T9SS type A sorting domain-containing protein [Aestuariibaculum sp. M13]